MDHICIMSEGNANTYIKILSHIQAFGVDLQYYYYYLIINWATKTDVGVTVYRYILCLYLVLPEQTWEFTGTWGQPLLNYPGRMDILGYYWLLTGDFVSGGAFIISTCWIYTYGIEHGIPGILLYIFTWSIQLRLGVNRYIISVLT